MIPNFLCCCCWGCGCGKILFYYFSRNELFQKSRLSGLSFCSRQNPYVGFCLNQSYLSPTLATAVVLYQGTYYYQSKTALLKGAGLPMLGGILQMRAGTHSSQANAQFFSFHWHLKWCSIDQKISDLDNALALAIGFQLSASDPRSPLLPCNIVSPGAFATSLS